MNQKNFEDSKSEPTLNVEGECLVARLGDETYKFKATGSEKPTIRITEEEAEELPVVLKILLLLWAQANRVWIADRNVFTRELLAKTKAYVNDEGLTEDGEHFFGRHKIVREALEARSLSSPKFKTSSSKPHLPVAPASVADKNSTKSEASSDELLNRWLSGTEIEDVLIDSLKPHPLNSAIYDADLDVEFLDSISVFGILQPLVITKDGFILGGRRRWGAVKELNLPSVPVRRTTAPEEFHEALILALNQQRHPNNLDLVREYLSKKRNQSALAKARQAAGVHLREKTPQGKARDLAASALDNVYSGKILDDAAKVYEAAMHRLKADSEDSDARAVLDVMKFKNFSAAAKFAKSCGWFSDPRAEPDPVPERSQEELQIEQAMLKVSEGGHRNLFTEEELQTELGTGTSKAAISRWVEGQVESGAIDRRRGGALVCLSTRTLRERIGGQEETIKEIKKEVSRMKELLRLQGDGLWKPLYTSKE